MRSRVRNIVGCALLAAAATSTLAGPSLAATSGSNGTHDPSRMVESNGKLWVYSTGGGSKSSPDGLVWTDGPRLFPNGTPSWVKTAVPNDQGIWAPDAIFYNGQYFVFYSVANKACAVGVLTSPTLDTTSPSFKWTDRGMVVSNPNNVTYCTIDPAPVVDADNHLWLAWGSGYSHGTDDDTIFVTRLDDATGLASTTDTKKPGYPLVKGHVEGSYIHFHAGYYYLWWNSGGCCNGASSTYTIHVARSQTITGPYTGAKNFYSSTGSIHGPGHLGIYNSCGVERFTYHYYPDTGQSVLGENELTWGADGWPVVGAQSTTPIKLCGMKEPGGTTPPSDAGSMTTGTGGDTADSGSNGGTSGSGGFGGSGRGGTATGSGGSGGSDNSSVGGSGGANMAGSAGSGGSSMEGSGGASTVTGSAGSENTTTSSAAGSSGSSGSSGGAGSSAVDTGNGSPVDGNDSGCTISTPKSSQRRGIEGFLIAAIGVMLVGARRRGSATASKRPFRQRAPKAPSA